MTDRHWGLWENFEKRIKFKSLNIISIQQLNQRGVQFSNSIELKFYQSSYFNVPFDYL